MDFFRGMKTRSKLITCFTVLMAFVFILGAISINRLVSMREAIRTIYEDRLVPVIDLDEINYRLASIRIGALRIINESDEAKRRDLFNEANKHEEEINRLIEKYSATYLVPEEKRVLDEFRVAWKGFNESRKNTYGWALEGDLERAKTNAVGDAAAKFKVVDEKIRRLIGIQDEVTKGLYEEAKRSYAFTRNIVIMSTIVVIAIAVASVLILTRLIAEPLADLTTNVASRVAQGDLSVKIEVNGRDEIGELYGAMKRMVESLKRMIADIKSMSDNLASASQELSASSEQMSRGVAEQSGRASQIATSATEMSQTVIDIAKNASNIASSATETTKIAQDGRAVVGKSVEEVKAIAETVNESARLMSSLGDRSKQIGEIVNVIKDIADQTNLLALNAAIEAARAGEQGRGFAVVADEVRKLAERTAKATSEIGEMIGAIQNEVQKAISSMDVGTKRVGVGVDLAMQAGISLDTIVRSVNALQTMVQQIASATEEMSTVSDQISGDIETIASVSRETSTSSEQVAQASADLAMLATKLGGIVGQFRV
ncbi:MAG TPA: methyl-accepting chemotaxis protein [Thermodesulfobacteriota bacterium]|nr:methyl-accepting chemotaxis protein [Thermodesulfobacteriota bacterium]